MQIQPQFYFKAMKITKFKNLIVRKITGNELTTVLCASQ